MAKSKKLQSETGSRCQGASLHKLSSQCKKVCGDVHHEKLQLKALETKEWDNAVCSVCLEFPHNAVLLLCSSYENGCRPYMCATSNRYSNCLEQYSKAYTKVTSNLNTQSVANMDPSEESVCPNAKSESSELLCPLCRGQVKGWTVVEPARRYLNAKKRACTQENCSFLGTYKEIKKHAKLEHPKACPRDVDPLLAEKWKKLERERDLSDVFSTIRANMPGALVLGDYVIEGNYGISDDYDDDDRFFDNAFFRFPAHGGGWSDSPFSLEGDYDPLDDEYFRRIRVRATLASRSAGRNISRIARPHARFLLARQGRRSRERR
ncbi:zinc finger/BTB domain protein [Perilla frutescens var. frutescens]|nr:zinc finger/BTB domain protein [Perilla frutescens var. frutescens]